MRAIANWIFMSAMSVWIGSIIFFSFVITPTLKAKLGTEELYQTVNALLPVYYQLGIAVGVIALVVAIVRTVRTEYPKQIMKWSAAFIIMMLGLNIVGHYVLLPEMLQLAPDFSHETFIQYYNFTQGINLLNLIFGLQVLLLVAIDMRMLPGRPARGGYSIRF